MTAGLLIGGLTIGAVAVATAFGLYQIRFTVTEISEVLTDDNSIVNSVFTKILVGAFASYLIIKTFPVLKKYIQ